MGTCNARPHYLRDMSDIKFGIFYSLPAPGIDGMKFPVPSLNDARVRVLADGTVLKCNDIIPMDTIIRDSYAERSSNTFGCSFKGGEIVVYENMSTVLKSDCICARVVIRHINECQRSPSVAIVAAPARGKL